MAQDANPNATDYEVSSLKYSIWKKRFRIVTVMRITGTEVCAATFQISDRWARSASGRGRADAAAMGVSERDAANPVRCRTMLFPHRGRIPPS